MVRGTWRYDEGKGEFIPVTDDGQHEEWLKEIDRLVRELPKQKVVR